MANRSLIISVFTAIVAIIVVVAVSKTGKWNRTFNNGQQKVFLTKTAKEVYTISKNRKLKGRTLLFIGSHNRSVAIDDYSLAKYNPSSLKPSRLSLKLLNYIDNSNLLWILMQTGIVRKIVYAVPQTEWERIATKITGNAESAPALDINFRGSPITVHTIKTIPEIKEPVILFIDGSIIPVWQQNDIIKNLNMHKIKYDIAFLFTAVLEKGWEDSIKTIIKRLKYK